MPKIPNKLPADKVARKKILTAIKREIEASAKNLEEKVRPAREGGDVYLMVDEHIKTGGYLKFKK